MAAWGLNKLFVKIHNAEILPGANEVIKIPVGRIPSGNQILIRAHVYRSVIDGPTALILAGVHGDEVNGVEIVRQAVASDIFRNIRRGTIIAIPILNVYGFINFSREVPDGKDVNRSFPGSLRGSLASRVARIISKKIIPVVDFGVDFHTGGRSIYNFPQIRYTAGDEVARELAMAFKAPQLLAKKTISKSLRKYAQDKGKRILVFEGGENLRLDDYSIANGLHGLRRLLIHQEMLPGPLPPDHPSWHYLKSSWLRAPRAGIFQWTKGSGQMVAKGEPIGSITDPYGLEHTPLRADETGHIIGHSNMPVVTQGDALFHIAYQPA